MHWFQPRIRPCTYRSAHTHLCYHSCFQPTKYGPLNGSISDSILKKKWRKNLHKTMYPNIYCDCVHARKKSRFRWILWSYERFIFLTIFKCIFWQFTWSCKFFFEIWNFRGIKTYSKIFFAVCLAYSTQHTKICINIGSVTFTIKCMYVYICVEIRLQKGKKSVS